jgi:Domain of unknown function (DUF4149)
LAQKIPLTWLKFPAALWWSSLSALGFFVVPMLFAHLPSKARVGNMAARLFEVQTWLSVACGTALLLLLRFQRHDKTSTQKNQRKNGENMPTDHANNAYSAIIFIAFGVLLTLLITFGVSPRIVARDNLMLWHSVGSAMFFVQWLCAGVVLWKLR